MQIVSKIGFYPSELIEKYPNVTLFCMNFADAGLIQQMYCKVNANASFNNLIHIHLDKYKAQASMFFEGVVNDKLSGLHYGKLVL